MPPSMPFGKFKGQPITGIDLRYLLWCRDNLRHCPMQILDELVRRGHTSVTPRQATKKARIEHKARHQRANAAEKLACYANGVRIPNPDFDRLREEYVKAGGDLTACPFDTDDSTYTGPGFVGLKHASLDQQSNSETTLPDARRVSQHGARSASVHCEPPGISPARVALRERLPPGRSQPSDLGPRREAPPPPGWPPTLANPGFEPHNAPDPR